jgi:hypothetical protein
MLDLQVRYRCELVLFKFRVFLKITDLSPNQKVLPFMIGSVPNALYQYRHFQVLDLGFSRAGRKGALALASRVKWLTALQKLQCEGNSIGQQANPRTLSLNPKPQTPNLSAYNFKKLYSTVLLSHSTSKMLNKP